MTCEPEGSPALDLDMLDKAPQYFCNDKVGALVSPDLYAVHQWFAGGPQVRAIKSDLT